MRKLLLFILAVFISANLFSQISPNKYWVKFTDKTDSPYSIENPEEFLTQRAIDRRTNQNIEIIENDLPVNPQYIEAVADIGVEVLNTSKWFNSLIVYTTNSSLIDEIEALEFVISAEKLTSEPNTQVEEKEFFASESFSKLAKNHQQKKIYDR